MSLKLKMPEIREMKPRILVAGVGGAGGNAVNNMIRLDLLGVDFVVANTDAQGLANSLCDTRVQLGMSLTEGLGAGARPEVGAAAAHEALDSIQEHLAGTHMAFITAGMGGGTGTGAAPVIAKLARDQGILTVGVVTKPFQFEGTRRMTIADEGIAELQKHVDTLIVIPNQNLFRIANEKTTFADAFAMADNVLHSGVRGITDLMVMPGLINLDFADVRTVMMEMGKAMMGTGEAEGENRAVEAAELAISNPLLDDVSLNGARGVLINITGGLDLTLFEVDEAASRIRTEVDPEANIIVGSTFSDDLNGQMRVSVFATGIEAESMEQPQPTASIALFNRPKAPAPAEMPNDIFARTSPESATELAAAQMPVEEPLPAPAALAPNLFCLENKAEAASDIVMESAEEIAAVNEAVAQEDQLHRPKSIGDAFIAPKPVVPENVAPVRVKSGPLRAEAFAEAAMTNGPRREMKRGPTLLERVTGRVRGKAESAAGVRPPVSTRASSVVENPIPAPASEADGDVEASPVLEDPIDIPAFLRRQAN